MGVTLESGCKLPIGVGKIIFEVISDQNQNHWPINKLKTKLKSLFRSDLKSKSHFVV